MESCCGPRGIYLASATSVCYCDFYTYVEDIQVISSINRKSVCTEAKNSILENSNAERRDLIAIYASLSGEHWLEQGGWATEEPDHCTWYGITCNQKGLVTEIALPSKWKISSLNLYVYLDCLTLASCRQQPDGISVVKGQHGSVIRCAFSKYGSARGVDFLWK